MESALYMTSELPVLGRDGESHDWLCCRTRCRRPPTRTVKGSRLPIVKPGGDESEPVDKRHLREAQGMPWLMSMPMPTSTPLPWPQKLSRRALYWWMRNLMTTRGSDDASY